MSESSFDKPRECERDSLDPLKEIGRFRLANDERDLKICCFFSWTRKKSEREREKGEFGDDGGIR